MLKHMKIFVPFAAAMLITACSDTSCKFEHYGEAETLIDRRLADSFENSQSSLIRHDAQWPFKAIVVGDDYSENGTTRDDLLYGSINADIVDANGQVVMKARLYADCEIEWLRP